MPPRVHAVPQFARGSRHERVAGTFRGVLAGAASYSAVAHADAEAVVEKAAYLLANPVSAGLVRRASDWPGLWTPPDQIGAAKLVARRPAVFFAPDGYLPDSVELVLTTPPAFASATDFQGRVAAALRRLESGAVREREREGRRFLGARKVLGQAPFARPRPGEPRFRLNPRVAGCDKWKRMEAISRLKEFLREYRIAWQAWRLRDPRVLFPAGTYQLHVVHGAPCASAS